nr:hypothetical protein [Tanacetum cinerariifolium]
EAAKFVGDFKSLAKEADSSLAKQKILELEIEHLQTKLERTKERFENCIIKKETEYAKLWNDWYKKCDECKYDKISYDKAYKDMQQKIERLQAQLGDLKENAHLKATYKNLFDSISVSRVQTETKIASLQNELQCNIYKNAKLGTQLFKKVSDQKDNNQDSSKNTKFAKQPIAEILPKIGETNALSKPVTSNSVSTPQVSKNVNNDKVIAPGMFRISTDKVPRKAKKVPNTVSASARAKSITVLQPSVITKKDMNYDLNGLSSTGIDNTKTRRPQPRSNTKNDRVPSASKSSQSKNKEVKVEEHHRNLLLSKKNKHMSSTCNSYKIDSHDVKSTVVCAKCKKYFNSVNHDVCLNNCMDGKKSRGMKHKANVSKNETQKKYQPKASKPKNVGTHESLATPKPRKPIFLLRWSPTCKIFDSAGKLVAPSGDNACTSNTMEPKIKRFPNSTSLLGSKKQKAKVSFKEIQMKYQPKVSKPKNVGTHESLATPKPRKPKFLLRWSPTGKMFYPAGYPDLFVVRRLRLFQVHDRKSKASHPFHLEVYGNCPHLYMVTDSPYRVV